MSNGINLNESMTARRGNCRRHWLESLLANRDMDLKQLRSCRGEIGLKHKLKQILSRYRRNKFGYELADSHVANRGFKHELPHHVLSERQFCRPLLALVCHCDDEIRAGRMHL